MIKRLKDLMDSNLYHRININWVINSCIVQCGISYRRVFVQGLSLLNNFFQNQNLGFEELEIQSLEVSGGENSENDRDWK